MNTDDVVALSVRQPWAHLIVTGRKSVELRKWATGFRGVLWIHASTRMDMTAVEDFRLEQCVRGAFIGYVTLAAVISMDYARWEAWQSRHLDRGAYMPGYYGWLLTSPVELSTPLAAHGQQRLFRPNAAIRDDLLGR